MAKIYISRKDSTGVTKIGILTFQNVLNYGTLLQAYALQETICSLGYDCKLINYQNEDFNILCKKRIKIVTKKDIFRKGKLFISKCLHPVFYHKANCKAKKLDKFCNNYFKLSNAYSLNNISSANNEFDIIVLGGEQVWNTKLYNYQTIYFLDFLESTTKAITYATSFGKNSFSGFEYYELKESLPKFSAIAMREKSGCEILKKYFNIDSVNVLDPTFLQKKEFWFNIAHKSKMNIKKDFILIYFMQEPKNSLKEAIKYAKENNFKIYSLNKLNTKEKYHDVSDASLEDFLYLIKNAKCVFTTSFYGLALSINMNTNLYYELSHMAINNNASFIDLCASLGLTSREIKDTIDKENIDWNDVNQKLDSLKNESIQYLKDNL